MCCRECGLINVISPPTSYSIDSTRQAYRNSRSCSSLDVSFMIAVFPFDEDVTARRELA